LLVAAEEAVKLLVVRQVVVEALVAILQPQAYL
jgi:hypothetical protein